MKDIYLAGGCFWGVDAYFSNLDGVVATEVGYANGKTETTSYEELYKTDFAETVKVTFNEKVIALREILEHFYYIINPFSLNRQGNDMGRQYRTGIYSENENDLEVAKNFLRKKQEASDRKILVEVEQLKSYVVAEAYHQDYLKKNPAGYCHIDLTDVLEIK
ncbi:peptide-methionine (S)-S-oxide reductase MsrA [Anaerococcus lactolyticus]|uniref:Peptide methionine sulfoxide reductase MsrA n=1 Tax=Anaerococcus lactolyticus S7-1-13 TaxID=1284686 RepID=A0A095YE94_9FIRM|nr:peptide-methionine (S)-S-oxide reductase MsrA [Anaerococcus lactolyticus]KGF04877.1 methionine sulfoxide reductase A [Anaerococcus lactolyticus S7-1-13]